MSEICVVHLVWARLEPCVLASFLAAYRERPAGREHELAVILNGFGRVKPARLASIESLLDAIACRRIRIDAPVQDLTAYRHAAEQVEARTVCFLNSYSRPLADGWLATLAAPLADAGVGMTGTGGSYESAHSAAPLWLRRRRRRDFAPFPNPHLRTNGFMLHRDLLLELDWPAVRTKAQALALESGRRSISRQIWERGLEVVVAGRNGQAYPSERWPHSATFRSGDQRNLLIADNRTRQYEEADPATRRHLEAMAWGNAALRTPSAR